MGYETDARRLLIPLFYNEPRDMSIALIDPLNPPKGWSNNMSCMWRAVRYALSPHDPVWRRSVIDWFKQEQSAHMHTEVGSATPYFEFYASGIALVIKTAKDNKDDEVYNLAIEWLTAEISLQSLGRVGRFGKYRIMIPGGRLGDIESATKNTIYTLYTAPGDRESIVEFFGIPRPSDNSYHQSSAMFTHLVSGEYLPITIDIGRLPNLLFNLNVEIYDLGFRLWYNDLSSGRGKDKPKVIGGPWWGVAANYDGSRIDNVSWRHFGINFRGSNENGRGAKAWGGRSLLMPRALEKWDMGRLRDLFVLGPHGVDREAAIVEGGQEQTKPRDRDKPKERDRDKPRDKPKDKDSDKPFSTIGQHTPIGRGSFCELCYLGARQHDRIKPGMQVPRRVEGDKGKGPPKEWGVDALGN